MATISRRTALTSVLGASVGTLVAPSVAGAASSPETLATLLPGPVAMPGQAAYTQGKQLFSPEFDARKPTAVVRVRSVDDVAAALRFASSHGLRVTARSGGHSYVGASAATGTVVLDLRGLAGISYDAASGLASIQAGARLYDVHRQLDQHGRTIPTGTCPTVGVSGLTSGGGLGISSRAHGLTADALVEAEIVLVSGRRVVANAHQNTDLFWAVRGGGGGLVGVVTRWTFATFPSASQGSFILDLPSSSLPRVLTGWAGWTQHAPLDQWANLHLTRTTSGVGVRLVGVGPANTYRSAAANLLSACGGHATSSRYATHTHMGMVGFLGGGTTSPRTAFTAGSDVLTSMTPQTVSLLQRAITSSPTGSTAILDPLTGAVQHASTTSTAFPWRNHLATVQWYTGRTGGSARAWIEQSHRIVHPVSAGRYVNYVEPHTSLGTYLGGNVTRAMHLKAQYDPHGTLLTSLG